MASPKRQKSAGKGDGFPGRQLATLRSSSATLSLDSAGGSIASFRLGALTNPLCWDSAVHDQKDPSDCNPRPLGHFLCLDRWGPPSAAEHANGMPYHGEASSARWDVQAEDGSLRLSATLPLAGLSVTRRARLLEAPCAVQAALAVFEDEVRNDAKLGRMYNMVQHPSIAAPFLTRETRVDCNGMRGFTQCAQEAVGALPWTTPSRFPEARTTSSRDARQMTGGHDDVFSYEVDPTCAYGWVTAYTPSLNLLLGYVWPRADYPWVSLWCSSSGEEPRARGLEFGTTGLHQPFPVLSQHPRIFDLPTFAYLDAGGSCLRRLRFFFGFFGVSGHWRV
ncbi:unnamed protein product [Symbiodinium natans]|uniref:Uncharacterized protein n=1 Tax=Symbiodinium natans TaxID=878477 RepID=A0A812U243_9DINO|nr:unnamed protein product [Symbiodinium natans]